MGLTRRARRRIDRWIVQTHRWLGIGICLLFVVWFASGLVMLYVDSPRLTQNEQLRSLDAIDLANLNITPTEAINRAGFSEFPSHVRLEMLSGDPVYRLRNWADSNVTISGVDGRVIESIERAVATEVAKVYSPESKPISVSEVTVDQWTFERQFDSVRPFHVVRLDDPNRTYLYVSARSGALVLNTSRTERFWNWPGQVLHLFEFSAFRQQKALWRNFMLWSTALSIIVATLGIWLGIKRLRIRTRFPRGNSVSPYRSMMKWHHISGVLGSIFLWTWIFSGIIYLRPATLLERKPIATPAIQRYAGHSSPDFPIELSIIRSGMANNARQIDFTWIGGQPSAVLRTHSGHSQSVSARTGNARRLSDEELLSAAQRLLPESTIQQFNRIIEPDEYWHTFRLTYRKLPIIRAEFDDDGKHWFHIDPDSGEILNMLSKGDRTFRWLFNGLHKIDFLGLQRRKWLRDIVVLPLMLMGLVISATGVVVGVQRIRRF